MSSSATTKEKTHPADSHAVESRDESNFSSHSKHQDDVFGDEENHQIHYKTLSWQYIGFFMIAEIVSNGMLSLPTALATVGIFPAVFLIIFLGMFALFTAKLLIDFKLNHPEVHSMGDAGFILFGWLGREVLTLGTIIFSVFATGSEILSAQQTVTELSNGKLCATYLILIFSLASFLMALPRTLNQLNWLGAVSCISILTAGVVGMIGAGVDPTPGRILKATVPQSFTDAFLAITNPVFAYAGHFMFFVLISEMKQPQDAMKAAWLLQGFATTFYVIFAVVTYAYIGPSVNSFSLLSLSPTWAKVALALALPNFLIAGGLYTHVPAKLLFIRIFRNRDRSHIHSHTLLGWIIWVTLCFSLAALAFIFCVAVPIFSFLIGLASSLFASWYTYGIAGFFGIYEIYHFRNGVEGLKRHKWMLIACLFTILSGAFICISGTFVYIKLLVEAYRSHIIPAPFTC